jgi:hypothetical protein
MEKINVYKNRDGEEYVQIDKGNGEFTSMLKSTHDEQQAHLTESVTKAK